MVVSFKLNDDEYLVYLHTQLCSGLALLPGRVKYPLLLDPSSIKGKFQFLPPRMVKVVGSYLLGTMAKPDLSVDLALYIPEVPVPFVVVL